MMPGEISVQQGGRGVLRGAALSLLFLALLTAAPAVVPAQVVSPQRNIVRSQSGQFLVQSTPLPDPPRSVLALTTSQDFIRLEPTFLAVSCERIRQALNQQLEARAPWQGKIFLALYPVSTARDMVYIASEKFKDGWQYQVRLPQIMDRARYVTAISQVLLLELANRGNPPRSAEIPPWLSEGVAQSLLSTSEIQLVLPPPSRAVNGVPVTTTSASYTAENPLARAHQQMLTNQPLTFQQLSWPLPEQLQDERAGLFRACAQLFVHDLLALPGGRSCLRSFVSELPSHLNWQLAFLKAFGTSFQRPLDVEKWWALHATCFVGRDLGQTWVAEESWRKLDEALRAPVEIRGGTNDLPMRGEATLQTIIRDWSPKTKTEALKAKLAQLEAVRLRLQPEMAPLVDEYRQVINRFLQNAVVPERGVLKAAIDRKTLEDALEGLDALDTRRKSMVAKEKPATAEPTTQTASGRSGR
jgi:hypothetical protein